MGMLINKVPHSALRQRFFYRVDHILMRLWTERILFGKWIPLYDVVRCNFYRAVRSECLLWSSRIPP